MNYSCTVIFIGVARLLSSHQFQRAVVITSLVLRFLLRIYSRKGNAPTSQTTQHLILVTISHDNCEFSIPFNCRHFFPVWGIHNGGSASNLPCPQQQSDVNFNAEIPLLTGNQTVIKSDFLVEYELDTYSLLFSFLLFYELHGFNIIPKRFYVLSPYMCQRSLASRQRERYSHRVRV